jgi:hypothetical protein
MNEADLILIPISMVVGLVVFVPVLLWLLIPLVSVQTGMVEMFGKKYLSVDPSIPGLQLIPFFNFFISYIVVWNLNVSILAWSNDHEERLPRNLTQEGLLACHEGMGLMVCLLFGVTFSRWFLLATPLLIILWVIQTRKYYLGLDEVYSKMKSLIPPKDNPTQE